MDSISWALLALVVVGGMGGWILLEMRLRALRTRVLQIPGGLLFEAQDFSVQVLRKEQQLRVQHVRGVWTPPGGSAVQGAPKGVRAECTFAAPGFRLEVCESGMQDAGQTTGALTGQFDIVMRGADGSKLMLERVNATVTKSFELFFLQVGHWIDKLERRAEQARLKQLRSADEVAQAEQYAHMLAQLKGNTNAKEPPTQAERDQIAATQIAKWREAAGFTGQHSLHKADANGLVVWFIDVATDGRITLHGDKRTIHSTLRGASIAASGGELEVGVRDAYWTEADPELQLFKVLRGPGPDERRAWKERLEIIRNSLPATAKP